MWNLIKAKLEDLAYSMGYDPATVEAIERESNGKLDKYCRKLFQDWLMTDHGCKPKTWQKLLERIKDISNLVAAAEKISEELGI